ncbi:MAG: hypothetical protein ACR2P9_08670 [Gammaproteobacteria bacterium]
MIIDNFLVEILSGLIVASIIGAGTSFYVIHKCQRRQAHDMTLMKKATAFVLRRQVQETKQLHPEQKDEIEDLEKTYKELTETK